MNKEEQVELVIEELLEVVANKNGRLNMVAAPSITHCRQDAAQTINTLLKLGGQWDRYPETLTEEEWNSLQIGADLSAALGHTTVIYLCGW